MTVAWVFMCLFQSSPHPSLWTFFEAFFQHFIVNFGILFAYLSVFILMRIFPMFTFFFYYCLLFVFIVHCSFLSLVPFLCNFSLPMFFCYPLPVFVMLSFSSSVYSSFLSLFSVFLFHIFLFFSF